MGLTGIPDNSVQKGQIEKAAEAAGLKKGEKVLYFDCEKDGEIGTYLNREILTVDDYFIDKEGNLCVTFEEGGGYLTAPHVYTLKKVKELLNGEPKK